MKQNLILIPARYNSTRLPGKPLVDINDMPMIQHVWQAVHALGHTYVVTDDPRISKVVWGFGGQVIEIKKECQSGTDRCYRAYRRLINESVMHGPDFDLIINVQGDEPMITAEHIQILMGLFEEGVEMATLVYNRLVFENNWESASNVWAVADNEANALYFSRAPIPWDRDQNKGGRFYKHIGVYAWRPQAFEEFAGMSRGILEMTERLEQLRWLEHGRKMKLGGISQDLISVDTPEDLELVRKIMK